MGAASESAAGPICGSTHVEMSAGRPTGMNVSPSNEYDAFRVEPSDVIRTQ